MSDPKGTTAPGAATGPKTPNYHDERWHTPQGRMLREVVFGVNDGVITTVGFVTGIAAAVESASVVLLAGMLEALAGSFSMGVGAYLSVKSQQEFFEHEIAREKREIEEEPEREIAEVREIYGNLGFGPEEIEVLVRRLRSDKDLFLRFMQREELGILSTETESPLRSGLWTAGAYAAGAFLPLVPLAYLHHEAALWGALGLGGATLFGLGATKTLLTHRSWLRSGLEMLALGLAAAAVGFLCGKGIEILFPQ